MIWPSASRPDLAVSIGTGSAARQPEEDAGAANGMFENGFVGRAIRAFLYSPAVDGNQGWQDALDSIPEELKNDIFRLDRSVPGNLPELDDVDRIDELRDFRYEIPDSLARALLATSFFFELDEEPILCSGVYHCQGSILCCRYGLEEIMSLVQTELPGARFMTLKGSNLGEADEHNGCRDCGYYRKRVTFSVSSTQEEIQLGIDSSSSFYKIGGFPTSVLSILQHQQADAVFGRADHCTDRWPPSRDCYCAIGSKRQNEAVPFCPNSKRRRVEREPDS
jgi:hypothetical protein